MADKFAYISDDRGATRKTKLRGSLVGTRDTSPEAAMGNTARYINDLYYNHEDKPKKVRVPVSKIRATQDEVVSSIIKDYREDPPKAPVQGIRDPHSGRVHLVDGHHRAEAAKLRGDKHIEAEIYDHKGIDKT